MELSPEVTRPDGVLAGDGDEPKSHMAGGVFRRRRAHLVCLAKSLTLLTPGGLPATFMGSLSYPMPVLIMLPYQRDLSFTPSCA